MFAYCLNNPICYFDPIGNAPRNTKDLCAKVSENSELGVIAAGALGIAGALVIAPVVHDLAETVAQIFVSAAQEVYEYSKKLREELAEIKRQMPNVHHIVPVGSFSTRSVSTQQMITELHNTLSNAGINRFVDPMNLVLVSAGTHASLHTDAYIAHVHDYIMSTDKSKEAIYGMLFVLRIEIAAMDSFANGY